MLDRFTNRFVTSAFFTLLFLVSSLSAQSLPDATPPDNSAQEPSVETPVAAPQQPVLKLPSKEEYFHKGFARQLISDQKPLWTSPARIKASDLKWLAPLAGGTAILFTQDSKISHHFDNKTSLENSSLKVGNVGLYAS